MTCNKYVLFKTLSVTPPQKPSEMREMQCCAPKRNNLTIKSRSYALENFLSERTTKLSYLISFN
jgi:hypothetical protein